MILLLSFIADPSREKYFIHDWSILNGDGEEKTSAFTDKFKKEKKRKISRNFKKAHALILFTY